MRIIYKYELEIDQNDVVLMTSTIKLPVGFKILKIDMQGRHPCLWALIDTEEQKRDVTFKIVGTGHPLENMGGDDHCGTFFQGPFVWHVFRVR